jgi:cell shape-determining protein MreC
VEPDAAVVTSGTTSRSDRLQSRYLPGIPVGYVTRVGDPGTDNQKIFLCSYADLQRLETVQVLTRPINGNRGS